VSKAEQLGDFYRIIAGDERNSAVLKRVPQQAASRRARSRAAARRVIAEICKYYLRDACSKAPEVLN
jgi:hypothetical protein